MPSKAIHLFQRNNNLFSHNFAKYKATYGWTMTYPLPQFTACLGFFLVYFIEEMIIKFFASEHAHSHHSHSETA
jgi:hypothetical protein